MINVKSGRGIIKTVIKKISHRLHTRHSRVIAASMAIVLVASILLQLMSADAAAVTIRQEINLINDSTYSKTNAVISTSEIAALTTTSYSGTVTYYFEVVGSATSASSGNVYLRRVGTTTNDATIAISSIGTSTSRVRSASFTPPVGTTEYFVYAEAAGAGKTLSITNARIVIAQTSNPLTATETQVEIGNSETGKSNTTASALNNPKYWRYDSADWSPTPSFYAEAVYQRQGAATPTFVQSKAGTNTSNAAVSVTLDSPPTSGNLLVAAISTSNSSVPTITDWTPLTAATASGGSARGLQMFYKISNGTEQTITSAVFTSNKSMIVSEYSGIDTSSPLDVQNSTTTASSATHTSPTVTATTNNGIVIFTSMARATSSWSNEQINSSTTGVNERQDSPTLINTLQLSDRLSVSAGSVNAVGTVASAAVGATAIAVFKAAPASSTISIKLQEDDGSFGTWSDVTNGTIVTSGNSTTPTRVRTSTPFTPTTGRHYRIVSSMNIAEGSYDVYGAKIIAQLTTGTSSWTDPFASNNANTENLNPNLVWYSSSMSSDGSVMLAGVSSGRLYKSTDSGATWSETQPAGAANANWYSSSMSSTGSIMLAGANGGRLYKSTDSGATWSETQPAGAANASWKITSMSSTGSIMLAGVNGGRLYKSTDSGATWSETQPAGAANASWNTSAMSSTGSVMLVGVSGGRLYKSTDSGATWSETQPAGNTTAFWRVAAMSSDGSVMLAGINGASLYKSTDTGVTWSQAQPAGNAAKFWYTAAMSSTGSVILAGVAGGRLYRSTNTGATWSETQPALILDINWNAAAMSSDGSVMLAGDYGGRLYKSTDSGATWSETQPNGNTSANWNTVAMSSTGSVMLAGIYSGRLYKSTDSGATWSETQPAGAVNAIWRSTAMSSDGSVMLAGAVSGRLYKSTDSGATWSETQPAGAVNANWRAADMSSDGSVMLVGATGGRLYRSTNTGATWSETQPAGAVNANWYSASMSSTGSVMLAGAASGRLYKSTDTGATWSETQPAGAVNANWYFSSMSSDGSIMLVGAYGGRLYKSTDTGATWSETQPAGAVNASWQVNSMSSDGSIMLAGVNGGRLYIYSPISQLSYFKVYSQLASGGNFAASTGLKGYYQYYDPAEWGGLSVAFYHEANGVSGGTADVKLQYNPNTTPVDVTNSSISDVTELESSSTLTMPTTASLIDVNVTGTGTINSSRLIAFVNLSSVPTAPRLLGPAAGSVLAGTVTAPVFELKSADPNSDYVQYKIQVCSDSSCSSVIRTIDQTSSQTGWSNQDSASSTAYSTGVYSINSRTAYYTYQAPELSSDTTYYWRAAVIDPAGGNTWSDYSAINSFTIANAPPAAPTLSAPANTATGISTTPAFQLATTDANSDYVQYYIEVCSDALCSSVVRTIDQSSSQTGWSGQDAQTSTAYVASSSIGGSTTATHTYQSPALSYNTTYYWRAKAIDPGGSNTYGSFSSINSFTTVANSAPAAPTLSAPANTATGISTTPAFQLATTDANSDYVQYYIEVCSDALCSSVVRTIDQSSSQTGWSGQDAQTSTAYVASSSIGGSTTATHTYQSPALTSNTTYYWRAKAIDPGGSNSYGSFSSIYSFTTAAAAVRTIQGGTNLRGGSTVQSN